MFYFLRQNLFEFANVIEVVGHTPETGKHLWTKGARFDEPVPEQTIILNPEYGTVMSDFFDTTIPLMSDRLLAALKETGVDNYDAYPMILQRQDTGEQWRNYKAVNFVGCIDAIDMDKSDCRRSSTGRLRCESITIDPARVGSAICFRLKEGPDLLVIHEKVADALRRHEFVAVLTPSTQDYDGE